MRTLAASLEVQAPAEIVWDHLTRYDQWPEWGVSIRSVDASGERVEPEATGYVTTVVGVRLPFVITDVEPGASWSWNVAGLPATGHEVAAIDSQRCTVRFTVPWLFAPYLVVLKASLRTLRAFAQTQFSRN